jgi:RNA polymerase sigma factor (sigma-70 family)
MPEPIKSAHQDCSLSAHHRAARSLINRYAWILLSEEDLMTLLLQTNPAETDYARLERHARTCYSTALYEACHQTDNIERREHAYHDLAHYLYRAAYNRWPDLAEDVTQQALLLVYEQIERCHSPATFLRFALFKLLQAFKAEMTRKPAADVPLLDDDQEGAVSNDPDESLSDNLEHQEFVQALVEALQRLPDERQRHVVVLRYIAGQSDSMIAQRLAISANHVRVLRNRALERLRNDASLQQIHQNP